MRREKPWLLFTGFEPSGDDHAAAVIAELKRRHPDLPIHAWGGPKMAAAGAEIVEETGQSAVMGIPGPGKIIEHQRINARIKRWLDTHGATVHIPVDSPAANFPICKMAQKRGLKVVHLVAPQVWAWGTWRIRKLRRLSDLVLCLLPFEEPWFRQRGVNARFVGHPLFDHAPDADQLAIQAAELPREGGPRLALLPGSRPAEWTKNFPLILDAFRALREEHPEALGVVAATNPGAAERLRQIADNASGWPEGMSIVHGRTDAAIAWCDLALVVSGTVTLQVARQRKPMVVFYKSNPLLYATLASWLVSTEFFTLPNLIAGREIVPELVPHFDGSAPIVEAARELLRSPDAAERQRGELDAVVQRFRGTNAALGAADAIERIANLPQQPRPAND